MATAATLIQETKRYLMSGHREPMNLLSGAVDDDDTTWTFTYDLDAIKAGAYISVDLEIVYVWSVTEASKQAVVRRAMLGSTAAAHSDQSLCTVNSRFPDFGILEAINADIDDLSAPMNGLYAVDEVTLTYNSATRGYDLTGVTDYIEILRVHAETPGPERSWPEIRRYKAVRNADTGDFPSGLAIILDEPGFSGHDIRVTYSKPFTHLTALTDNTLTVAGLAATMNDIPPLGAAARLSGVREVARNFTESQSDARRAQEVPPNAQLSGSAQLMRQRQLRINAEADRLVTRFPKYRVV